MSGQVSENQLTYDEVIQHFANNPSLPGLIEHDFHDFFPQSSYAPHLLTINLNSETRVIRKIEAGANLAHTLFRGFYFQLLKLSYQMIDEQSQKNYIQILKSIVFEKALQQNQQSQKYLKYLSQFFILMQQEEDYAIFEQIIGQYPQIDEAFNHVLSFFLQSQSQGEQENVIQITLNELSDFFQIGLISNHPFYKFQESDIYLFVDGDGSVYIVYDEQELKEISQISSSKQSQQKAQSHISKEGSNMEVSNNRKGQVPNSILEGQYRPNGQNRQSYFDLPVSQHRQVQTRFQQQVQQISRPYSENSVKSNQSNKEEAKQFINRQQFSSNFTKNQTKNTTIVSHQYQPTYSLPKTALNHYNSPSTDKQFKSAMPNSSQRKVGQHSGQYSASSYYDGIYGDIPQNTSAHLNSSKNDTIINIFGDMLKSGKFQNQIAEQVTRSKRLVQVSQKILESQQQFEQPSPSDLYPNFKKINKVDMTHMIDQAKSVKSVNQHMSELNSASIVVSKINQQDINEKNTRESDNWNKWNRPAQSQNQKVTEKSIKIEENYNSYDNLQEQRQVANFDDEDSIFYKPKKSQLRVISEVTASKETITHKNSDKQDETKGSVYRQFSDTKILKLLKQPYKTKVQLMRNRVKGQHFNL